MYTLNDDKEALFEELLLLYYEAIEMLALTYT